MFRPDTSSSYSGVSLDHVSSLDRVNIVTLAFTDVLRTKAAAMSIASSSSGRRYGRTKLSLTRGSAEV